MSSSPPQPGSRPAPPQVEDVGPPRLRERFGELDLPYLRLGHFPTPVEPLEALSRELGAEVWVKRDDRAGPLYGGNKVRKLELLLADALQRGRRAVVTTGAVGSHHCLATTLYARAAGLDVHLVLYPQPLTDHVLDDLLLDHGAGAVLHRASRPSLALLALHRVAAGLERGGAIPIGGSSPLGAIGFVEAGLELAGQVEAGALPPPDVVVVPMGTCGTAAGLALGLELGGLEARVVGVRVVPAILTNRLNVRRLQRGALRLLRRAGLPSGAAQGRTQVTIDPHELGPGYGVVTPAATEAVARLAGHGVTLETTYTGKAAAALLRRAANEDRGRRILFWNTFSSVDLSPRLTAVAPSSLPPEWHDLLREGGRL